MSTTPTLSDVTLVFRRRYQQLLDRTVVHTSLRWAAFFAGVALFLLRVYLLQGWFIVTYGLGIYLLNQFIGFLTPQVRASRLCLRESPMSAHHAGAVARQTAQPSRRTMRAGGPGH